MGQGERERTEVGMGRSILISVKGDGGETGSTMNRHSALQDKPELLLRA